MVRMWRFLVALAVFCLFLALYLSPGLFQPRIALSSQFPAQITHIGFGLILAAAILAVAFRFGRFYCSLLCPAGFVQELFHRLGGRLKTRRLRSVRSRHRTLLLIAVAAAMISGVVSLVNFLDPLGLFGRLALMAAGVFPGAGEAGVLALTLLGTVLLTVVPLFRGRWFCDRLCPVGALLGLAASAGRRGMALDAETCVSCGRCEKLCPVRAIDSGEKRLDASRCVLCFDCQAVCPAGSLSYRKQAPGKRRDFLRSAAAAGAGGLYFLARPLARGFGFAEAARPDVVPPGSGSFARHRTRCVSCQACVPACPVGIIRMRGADLRPVLDYDRGYCQYDCVACADSCPAGALKPLTPEEKQRTRLASTRLESGRCVAVRDNQSCGACAEVCPTHAVRMADRGDGLATVPDFDARHCIGCGACYHVCPVEPRAFTLEGLARHELSEGVRPGGHGGSGATPGKSAEELGDFPF